MIRIMIDLDTDDQEEADYLAATVKRVLSIQPLQNVVYLQDGSDDYSEVKR